jgi:superfamily II DNA/RNA helicase
VSDTDVQLEFLEKFFIEHGLEPYPIQEEAFSRIFAGQDVLVTVPTGTGKTMMAKAGILGALRTNKKAIYTTPLRALTEEKYRELCFDFGADNVGFATGDYKVNADAPIQVLVAEILWNRIYSDHANKPADIVIMDEGHYFNDPERGYVWEQSIIGLHPDAQLVILSATVGAAQAFCQWCYVTRKKTMELVAGTERKVPLYHRYEESYLIEKVKELYDAGDYPALIFCFSRRECFERAHLLRSCPRFVSKDEQDEIARRSTGIVLDRGLGPQLEKLLQHGIGVHHAGVLPAYRRLVEELTAERLLKFVVTTETIAAGINLPAKRVVFPSLRKHIKGEARLLTPAEYHQMSGRAGRPQFDTEGIAITLGPEEVVQEFRKEIRDLKKRGVMVDEAKIKQKHYNRAKTEARANKEVIWDAEIHGKLVAGEPAPLKSHTQITAEQILAIGLPDLTEESLPGEAMLVEEKKARGEEVVDDRPPPSPLEEAPHRRLNIRTVIDHLLLPDHKKWEAHKRLAMITANLKALEVLDPHGRQIAGEIIGQIRGLDGVFVHYALVTREMTPELCREMVEYLIDHDAIQRIFDKKELAKVKDWIRERLRDARRENPNVTWEDIEEEYWREHPRELLPIELVHQEFVAKIPHPELHGGKQPKKIWAEIEADGLSFVDYVERHQLDEEEGSLFTYLARVMKAARMLKEVTGIGEFETIEMAVRSKLAAIDERVLDGLW